MELKSVQGSFEGSTTCKDGYRSSVRHDKSPSRSSTNDNISRIGFTCAHLKQSFNLLVMIHYNELIIINNQLKSGLRFKIPQCADLA